LLAAILNGLARVSAGLHWPTDILGGVVTGAVSFGLIWLLLRWYKPGRKYDDNDGNDDHDEGDNNSNK